MMPWREFLKANGYGDVVDAERVAALAHAAAESKAREDALRDERDRLQRLLHEQAENCVHRAMSERLSNQVKSERALRAIVEEECDRLKGELAEARRFIQELAEVNNCGEIDCSDAGCDNCAARRFLAVPSPAESTGVLERWDGALAKMAEGPQSPGHTFVDGTEHWGDATKCGYSRDGISACGRSEGAHEPPAAPPDDEECDRLKGELAEARREAAELADEAGCERSANTACGKMLTEAQLELADWRQSGLVLGEARRLLERTSKYVREDRAVTPGVTRLARLVAEIDRFLARQDTIGKSAADRSSQESPMSDGPENYAQKTHANVDSDAPQQVAPMLDNDWFCSTGCMGLVRSDIAQGRCLGCGFIMPEAAPSPAESTCGKCTVCGEDLPAFWSLSIHSGCAAKEAAPPDDIRDANAQYAKAWAEVALRHLDRIDDHERRLEALEGRVTALCYWAAEAPAFKAGHAFWPSRLDPSRCGHVTSPLTACARVASDPIHTGAKP